MTFHRVLASSLAAIMLAMGTGCSAVSSPHQSAAVGTPGHLAGEPGHDGAVADLEADAYAPPSDSGDPTDGGEASSTHLEGFPPGTVVWPENGHGYLLVTQTKSLTWDAARTDAESRGGHLVTITSQAENDFVYSQVGTVDAAYSNNGAGDNGPWLGAYQPDGSVEPGGGWTWVTGEPFVYAEWAHCLDGTCTEPDNNGPGGIAENYLAYFVNWVSASVPPAPGTNRGPFFDDQYLAAPIVAYIVEFE